MSSIIHKERKHSKFSASGAERWMACPGSVALSEGLPDKSNKWAEEGTKAHELLEKALRAALKQGPEIKPNEATGQMLDHVQTSMAFIWWKYKEHKYSELLVETRVHLDFIHPEMFGTFDSAIVDHFGTLHVFDFKYGSHGVSPKDNLQMIFYGLGLAYKYDWNFSSVRLWIIQPRIHSFDGPVFWDVSIGRLRSYVSVFKKAVDRVEAHPNEYAEGTWCHWCKAKSICPLKREVRLEKVKQSFKASPIKW